MHGEVQRQIKTCIQQQRGEESGGDLTLERMITKVVFENLLAPELQQIVIYRPLVGVIDLWGAGQGGENTAVGAGMDGLHEGNVGMHRLFMFGLGILDLADFPYCGLDRVQHGQASEDPHGRGAFLHAHGFPRGEIVGEGHLLRHPKIGGQPISHLQVLLVADPVPVDRAQSGGGVLPVPRRGAGLF